MEQVNVGERDDQDRQSHCRTAVDQWDHCDTEELMVLYWMTAVSLE